MPFKTFADGSVLTANDVNEYMMNQQIMVFNNGTTRDSQILNPTEGMIAYLKDLKRLTYFDSSSWRFL